jgi:LEA14-like dessication related protein
MLARRIIVVFIVLLSFFAAAAIWWGIRGKDVVKKEAFALAPRLKVKSITVSEINHRFMTVIINADLRNQLQVPLIVDSLAYDLYIDSVKIIKSAYIKKIDLEPDSSTDVKLRMQLDAVRLRSIMERFDRIDRDSAIYTLKTKFLLKLPVMGNRRFEINENRVGPAIKEIKVEPGKMAFDKMGLKKTRMHVPLVIHNHNTFPIRMNNARYSLEVEHGIVISGGLDQPVNVPAEGSQVVQANVNAKTSKLAKLGWKWLARKKHTHFHMVFSCLVNSDNEVMKHTILHAKADGLLEELKP